MLLSIRAMAPARDSADRLTESGPLGATAMRAGGCVTHDTLPGGSVSGTVDERCADTVDALLQNDTAFGFVNLVPTSTGWFADRGYLCLVTSADGPPPEGDDTSFSPADFRSG